MVGPRCTTTPDRGTSANCMVLFGSAAIASARSRPDLVASDIEGRDHLDVAHRVATQIDMHQAGNALVRGAIAVELDALDQGSGAIADADDTDANLTQTRLQVNEGTNLSSPTRARAHSCAGAYMRGGIAIPSSQSALLCTASTKPQSASREARSALVAAPSTGHSV